MNLIEKYTDNEVVEKVLNGEKSLYEVIIRKYNPYLYKVGRSYNYNHEDTEDLMQETYIDAYRNLSQFENRSNFKTWLIRIMLNNCYRKKQKHSFKNEIMKEEHHENSIPLFAGNDNHTNRHIHKRELNAIIEKALLELPEDYRIVFSLREINGLNVSEAAHLLNISEANVKTRLSRAKSMLQNHLTSSYSPADLYEFNLVYCDAMVNRVMNIINKI